MEQKRGVIWIHNESRCSYKPGEMSKIFAIHTDQSAANKKDLYSEFLPKGFIVSRNLVFAPDCNTCNACVPLRIQTEDYNFSANDKAILRHNKDLNFTFSPPGLHTTLSPEYLDLFRRHARQRLPGSGQDQWNNTRIRDYVEGHSGLLDIRAPDGALRASVVFNYLDQGLAPYYIFFDPDKSDNRTSLGTLCILKMIEHTRTANPGPVYLGHWVSGDNKLDYKKRFRHLEALTDKGWRSFDPLLHITGPDYRLAIPSGANHFYISGP